MHVCILTPYAPPENPRVVKEAAALVDAGHRVTVVCGRYGGWSYKFASTALTECTVKEVHYGPTVAPHKRLMQLGRRFGSRMIVAAGLGSTAAAVYAYNDATPGLRSAAVAANADLYIAHYTAALPAAAAAARVLNRPYAFDAEDFHPGDTPDTPEYSVEQTIIRTIERAFLPGCAYITAASPGIGEAYAAEYGLPLPTTVLNAFPLANAPESATSAGSARPGPSLYWFSQIIGPNRGLECAVRAIALARTAPHLYLRGVPAKGYVDRLRSIGGNAAERIHILEPAAPNEMERLAAVHDLGFVGETGYTRNRMIALTNKQFSYLLAGVPALMSDTTAHRAFAHDAEDAVALFPVDDASALAVQLDAILTSPERLASMRARAFQLGQERLNWEYERTKLVGRIAECVAVERLRA